jgi:hypothetical protein
VPSEEFKLRSWSVWQQPKSAKNSIQRLKTPINIA